MEPWKKFLLLAPRSEKFYFSEEAGFTSFPPSSGLRVLRDMDCITFTSSDLVSAMSLRGILDANASERKRERWYEYMDSNKVTLPKEVVSISFRYSPLVSICVDEMDFGDLSVEFSYVMLFTGMVKDLNDLVRELLDAKFDVIEVNYRYGLSVTGKKLIWANKNAKNASFPDFTPEGCEDRGYYVYCKSA